MNRNNGLCFLARLAFVVSAGVLSACATDYGSDGSSRTVSSQTATAPAPVSGALVTRTQTLLTELGFEPGPVDGKEGAKTASAVRAYQGAAGLRKDGRVSAGLVDHLAAAVERRQVVGAQSRLAELGYDPGPVDGHTGPRTRGAVEEFQDAEGLTQDGRITPDLLAALEKAEAKDEIAATEAAEEPVAAEAETEAAAVETATETATEEVATAETETAATETATEEVATAAAAATAAGAAATQAVATSETETAAESVAEEAADKAEEVAALATDDQTLKAGDRVQLSYLGAAQKSLELEIGQDGLLTVPDAGSVEAAGLDVEALRDKVTVKLIESYLDKIDIDVGLVQAAGGESDAAAQTLAAGDQVLVSLSGAKTASSELEVAADGSLAVPEAGNIQAAGLGLAELKEEIGVKLLESYMGVLDVTVERMK